MEIYDDLPRQVRVWLKHIYIHPDELIEFTKPWIDSGELARYLKVEDKYIHEGQFNVTLSNRPTTNRAGERYFPAIAHGGRAFLWD
jgi:hypothetical protein